MNSSKMVSDFKAWMHEGSLERLVEKGDIQAIRIHVMLTMIAYAALGSVIAIELMRRGIIL